MSPQAVAEPKAEKPVRRAPAVNEKLSRCKECQGEVGKKIESLTSKVEAKKRAIEDKVRAQVREQVEYKDADHEKDNAELRSLQEALEKQRHLAEQHTAVRGELEIDQAKAILLDTRDEMNENAAKAFEVWGEIERTYQKLLGLVGELKGLRAIEQTLNSKRHRWVGWCVDNEVREPEGYNSGMGIETMLDPDTFGPRMGEFKSVDEIRERLFPNGQVPKIPKAPQD